MSKAPRTAITPTRAENFPEWYQQVIKAADMAENSGVRGCMVIKPWGYGIWEKIQADLDRRFKETGHQNAYFPLFIPKSYLEKEAAHVEGFAKECAVVTHQRLILAPDGKTLIPDGELEEPLIVRPTSETIIGESFSRWVQSYRDLPILINQWANVVRWEMRTRLFLRTAEFLWQEGHTAHATKEEALEETYKMLGVYHDFANEVLAIPVMKGKKTDREKFPGADTTLCIEALMQDGKALQAGTSHFLGQNFAKGNNIQFLSSAGVREFAYTTSWGVSTRLIGAVIMAHSDDDGLRLPPRIAPSHVVIIPVMPKEDDAKSQLLEAVQKIAKSIRSQIFHGRTIDVSTDLRDGKTGGEKNWEWIKKGIPVRIEVGMRELERGEVTLTRRTKTPKDKENFKIENLCEELPKILQQIQDELLSQAITFRDKNIRRIKSYDDLKIHFKEVIPGFARAHWDPDHVSDLEDRLKNDFKATIRCVLLEKSPGICFISGKKTDTEILIAESY